MPDALIPVFRIKVLDPVSGAAVVDPLPHAHQASYEVRAVQAGTVGATSIGTFSVPLLAPGSSEWASAQAAYSQLSYMQRIELYDGDVTGGDPKFTGYITGLPSSLNNYTLTGSDSTWLAQRSRTDRNYAFNGSTDMLLKNALQAYALTYGDDAFSSLAGYTNNGTWTLATDEGLPAATAGSGGDGLLYTTTSYANANYSNCVVDGVFHITCGSTPSNAAEAGIIAAVADANNYVLGRALMTCVNSTLWRIDAEVWTKIAGAFVRRAVVPVAVNLTSNVWRGQVRLFGVQNGADYLWRTSVGGVEPQPCAWTQTATSPSGAVGFRSNRAGFSGSSCSATYLCFQNKKSIFAQGSITAGARTINQKFSRSPLLDLWTLAATTESAQWRKNPKAGLFADTVDFGQLGASLTSTVFLEEGVNLVEPSSVQPNAEIPATEIELSSGPSNQGSVTWHNITAMRKYGVVSDNASTTNVTDFLTQRSVAKAIADHRATPGQAKQLTILRDSRYASATSPTGMLMRELDTVDVTSPRLGLFHQAVKIMGYQIQEGLPTMTLFGDQFPKMSGAGQDLQLRRLSQQVDFIANALNSPINGVPTVVDANGNLVADNLGLSGVMSLLTSHVGNAWNLVTLTGVAGPPLGVTGTGGEVDIGGGALTFTLDRPVSVLLMAQVSGGGWVVSGPILPAVPCYVRVNGQVNSPGLNLYRSPTLNTSPNPTAATCLQVLPNLGAGTYTCNFWWNSVAGTNDRLDVYTYAVYAFRLGY